MDLDELSYEHPEEAVAQRPPRRREDARLLLVPAEGPRADSSVARLADAFEPGEVLVLNETRVRPARIAAARRSGGRVDLLLLERRAADEDGETWSAVVGANRTPGPGTEIVLPEDWVVTVVGRESDLFVLRSPHGLEALLERCGRMPLPPYVRRPAEDADRERYQTTYARERGEWRGAEASAAAPTAGLHLSTSLLQGLVERGVRVGRLSLGVGPGTWRPVQECRVEDHRMHAEAIDVPEATAALLQEARREGARVTAVGTTTLRALEAAATPAGRVRALRATTGLFLVPGSRFRVVDRLLTNFHQPRSTLLALVQAFAGRARIRSAYAEAIARGYRLFSYGDAMLLERTP